MSYLAYLSLPQNIYMMPQGGRKGGSVSFKSFADHAHNQGVLSENYGWFLDMSSVQFSPSVMSNSLQPHGLQHARLPCPSPTPRACSNSCPLSRWCHPTISSCRALLFPPLFFLSISVFSSESVPRIRWPEYWNFSFNISPSNDCSWLISFRIDWFDLQSKGLSRVFSNTSVQKHQFFGTQLSL